MLVVFNLSLQPITAIRVSVRLPAGAAGGEEAAGGGGEDEEASVSGAACDSAGGVSAAEVKAPELQPCLIHSSAVSLITAAASSGRERNYS